MAFDYLERFEDGDASDWTNLTALNNSTLSGNWLGEVASSNALVLAESPSFTTTDSPVYFELYITADTNTSPDNVLVRGLDATDANIFEVEHEDDTNNVLLNGTVVGSWSAQTVYTYALRFDYTAETITIEQNGTQLDSGIAFDTAGAGEFDNIEIRNQTDGSGSSRSAYFDDLAYLVVPNTPQNFAAVQGGTRGEIDTSWDDVAQEDSYNLYRSESGGVTTADTLVTEPGQDVITFTDTGLEDGEQFYYAVTAEDEEGESALSNEDSAVTILPQTNFDTVQNV
jgi:hypothetical protein